MRVNNSSAVIGKQMYYEFILKQLLKEQLISSAEYARVQRKLHNTHQKRECREAA